MFFIHNIILLSLGTRHRTNTHNLMLGKEKGFYRILMITVEVCIMNDIKNIIFMYKRPEPMKVMFESKTLKT